MHLQTHRGQCDSCEFTGWCNYLWVGIYDERPNRPAHTQSSEVSRRRADTEIPPNWPIWSLASWQLMNQAGLSGGPSPPIVLSWNSWNWPLTKRSTKLDFPTADSPSNTSLNWQILVPALGPLGLVAPPRLAMACWDLLVSCGLKALCPVFCCKKATKEQTVTDSEQCECANASAHAHGTFKPCKTFCSILPNRTCDVWHFYNTEQWKKSVHKRRIWNSDREGVWCHN